ncbi:MAG: hypothetical protein MHM6MM_000648 [Cercozoa sp. M6MM]
MSKVCMQAEQAKKERRKKSEKSIESSSTEKKEKKSEIKNAKDELEQGILRCNVLHNNGDTEVMRKLMNFKAIVSTQLPKMPKDYIVRLIMDRAHHSLVLEKKVKCKVTEERCDSDGNIEAVQVEKDVWRIVGGICYRPFFPNQFAEIVFLAVTRTYQVRGYGSLIMNHLKEHVKRDSLNYFLTYADNFAIPFFRKQGFTTELSMPDEQWRGYIKDYEGGTLMECAINHRVDYLRVGEMIARQRLAVARKMCEVSHSHVVNRGLQFTPQELQQGKPLESLPGLSPALLRQREDALRRAGLLNRVDRRPTPLLQLQAKMFGVWKQLHADRDSWPFRDPVDAKDARDYYAQVQEPMDLGEIERRLRHKYYKNRQMFRYDFDLIVRNCIAFNAEGTSYHECAVAVRDKFDRLMEEYGIDADDRPYPPQMLEPQTACVASADNDSTAASDAAAMRDDE